MVRHLELRRIPGHLTVKGMSSQEEARVPLVWGLLRFPPQTIWASLVDQW